MTIIGSVESRCNDVVNGWVADHVSPLAPVAIDVVYKGKVIDRFIANTSKHVLLDGNKPENSQSFEYNIREQFRELELLYVPTGSVNPLLGLTNQGKMIADEGDNSFIDGFLEHVGAGRVSGWVKYSDRPDVAVKINISTDGELIGEGIANLFREDLADAFGTSGFHAFDVAISRAPSIGSTVDVRPFGSLRCLPGVGPASEVAPSRAETFVGSLDTVEGGVAAGWAYDPANPDQPCDVEFLVNDVIVGTTRASLYREDVKAAGFGNGIAGFRVELDVNVYETDRVLVRARVKNGAVELTNSPRDYGVSDQMKKWLTRGSSLTAEALTQRQNQLKEQYASETLSIIMPVYNTRLDWLEEAIESVRGQWCPCWELLLVDDFSPDESVREALRRYSESDPRIEAIFLDHNSGIAKATNTGIRAATGNYIALMDHDDVLEPDAVERYLNAAEDSPDIIYCDELITGARSDTLVKFCIRPSFSYDYYLSHPYFVHMVCAKRSLAIEIGGWDESKVISGDVDFVLRLLGKARKVSHVPAVLYRWRTHAASAGHAMLENVTEATVSSLNRHFNELGVSATASAGLSFNQYRIDYPDDHGKVLIVIPTKNQVNLLRKCVESVMSTTRNYQVRIVIIDHESDDLATTEYLGSVSKAVQITRYIGPFNYSAMNNQAIYEFGGDCKYVLLLNNDIEALDEGWLERLRSLASRSDVGAAGATLLYPNRTIQHSGVIVGLNGAADHAHKFAQYESGDGVRNPGYLGALSSVRDYSAITAACMMMRMDVFKAVNGLDERLEVGFNDTDLCLRIVSHGLKCLIDPYAVLIHHESATRSITKQVSHPEDTARFVGRWAEFIDDGDPFYSPLLLANGPDHVLGEVLGTAYPNRCVNVVPPATHKPKHVESGARIKRG